MFLRLQGLGDILDVNYSEHTILLWYYGNLYSSPSEEKAFPLMITFPSRRESGQSGSHEKQTEWKEDG